MPERLVDVIQKRKGLLHVFPVTIDRVDAQPADFERKALESAAFAGLVPNEQLRELSAELHVCHSGPLEPQCDDLGVLAETPAGLEQMVRERAYFLWEKAGQPKGRADDFWHKAETEHLRHRAYALWEREGRPNGRAYEHWCQVCRQQDI